MPPTKRIFSKFWKTFQMITLYIYSTMQFSIYLTAFLAFFFPLCFFFRGGGVFKLTVRTVDL